MFATHCLSGPRAAKEATKALGRQRTLCARQHGLSHRTSTHSHSIPRKKKRWILRLSKRHLGGSYSRTVRAGLECASGCVTPDSLAQIRVASIRPALFALSYHEYFKV